MVSDRMAMVLAQLDRESASDGPGGCHGFPRLATSVAAEVVGVDGLCAGVGTASASTVLVWGAETVGAALEDLQFGLGEGPSHEVMATGVPLLIPDLAGAESRWPVFVPAAMDLGVRAVFVFPLRIGAIGVGTMLAYRTVSGSLAAGQTIDALALADALTLALLPSQWPEEDDCDRPGPGWARPATYRAEVHQATGMVSVQLEISLADALVRLRAYAWARDRLLTEVAGDVVARRLCFDDPNL